MQPRSVVRKTRARPRKRKANDVRFLFCFCKLRRFSPSPASRMTSCRVCGRALRRHDTSAHRQRRRQRRRHSGGLGHHGGLARLIRDLGEANAHVAKLRPERAAAGGALLGVELLGDLPREHVVLRAPGVGPGLKVGPGPGLGPG